MRTVNGRSSTVLVDYDHELGQLSRQLADWRRTHKAPTPIPGDVWSKAAELAAKRGVCPVARTLGLNSATLKQKMNGCTASVSAPATFIELVGALPSGIPECAVEVESPRGGRMRVVMKNVPPAGLASIIRDFVG